MAAYGVQPYQPCVNRFGTFSGSRTSARRRCRLARRFAATRDPLRCRSLAMLGHGLLSQYDRGRRLGNCSAFFTAAHPSTGRGS
jgi:hypothetical protein